jgi:hypothetical protein
MPVVGGLFLKPAGSAEALVSIVCGISALLFVQYGTSGTGWMNPNLWGLIGSAIGYLLTLVLRRP